MKTSNSILTVFSIFFLVYVFAIVAEFRFRGEKNELFTNNGNGQAPGVCITEFRRDLPLPSFKVLKIKGMRHQRGCINLNPGARNNLYAYANSKEELPELQYHTSGDTLFIDKINKQPSCNQFNLELSEPPQKLIVDSMMVRMTSTSDTLKALNISGSNARFELFNQKIRRISIAHFQMDLDHNSYVMSISDFSVNNFEGKILKNSKVEIMNFSIDTANVLIGGGSKVYLDRGLYHNSDPTATLTYQKMKSAND